MVRDYELMYIVRPDVDDDGLRAAVDSVRSLIEGQGGEVRRTTMWGKRRLAYEVSHLRDGHYVIVEMQLDGSKVANVERALRIHDTVFRHLLVVQEAPSADGEGLEGEAVDGAEREVAGEPDELTATAPTAATADATETDTGSDDEEPEVAEVAAVGADEPDEEA